MEGLGEKIVELLHELEPIPLAGSLTLDKTAWIPTQYMAFLILALVLTFAFLFYVSRKASLVPKSRLANLGEAGVEFVRGSIVMDVMGPDGMKYAPFIITVFFAVLFNNFVGLIPGFKPGTGTLGTTMTWGLIVFVFYNAIGFKRNGVWGYLKSFLPTGTPGWLAPLIYPLEVISHFLRPFTLGVRLYANMYAGHIVLGVFAIFVDLLVIKQGFGFNWGVGALALVMQIIMYAFEVFVSFIQAYVFTILTAVYLNGALHATEH